MKDIALYLVRKDKINAKNCLDVPLTTPDVSMGIMTNIEQRFPGRTGRHEGNCGYFQVFEAFANMSKPRTSRLGFCRWLLSIESFVGERGGISRANRVSSRL